MEDDWGEYFPEENENNKSEFRHISNRFVV